MTKSELIKILSYCPYSGVFTRLLSNSRGGKVGDVVGSKNTGGYLTISVKGKQYYAHRLAWLYVHGEMPQELIDHINMIKDDNRILNLRKATPSQNQRNQTKASANSSSGLLGVCWSNALQKWLASITINYKQIHLGYFDDKYEAHQAYLLKKREIHAIA